MRMLTNFEQDMKSCIRLILFWAARHPDEYEQFNRAYKYVRELHRIAQKER